MTNLIELNVRMQTLERDTDGYVHWTVQESAIALHPEETALVLCDVWDHHWCRGAVERLDALLPRMNAVVKSMREKGVLIVHAPSDTMDFYADSPARLRMLTVPRVEPSEDLAHDTPRLPIDDADGGCDTDNNCAGVDEQVWTRQHPAIDIDPDRDVISDNGRELYSYYRHRNIKNVILMGVHTNMCILNRTFAIKQMVKWGVDIMLIRDLTDAMYNPERPPYVNHDEGTQLVIDFIEKHWCPTISSQDLLR